jgi:hypothetical protein
VATALSLRSATIRNVPLRKQFHCTKRDGSWLVEQALKQDKLFANPAKKSANDFAWLALEARLSTSRGLIRLAPNAP